MLKEDQKKKKVENLGKEKEIADHGQMLRLKRNGEREECRIQ
jgi:hypothetical protein